ncbi:hypothetical protein GJU39_20550 [Pedobacter petrophilus]|uniref:Uncharacterized protein n=1 Tax=Pedobacter petrophilus TaxID=1908241 RepID=A0A7K0G3U1_9SPHI|nr:hypothetical protein [Pedobacter petrophilus]MRX78473.1 hypothetical protein [Pedobacter petrophilus]
MKLKIFTLSFLSAIILLGLSCRKPELLEPEQPKVIQFTVTGSTTVDLEYLYRDSIIATTKAGTGEINVKTLLSVNDQNAVLQVRKKGSTEIVLSKAVMPAPFNQNIIIYYDGTKVYDQAISLLIKGYALTGELEFLLDGNIILSKSGAVDNRSSVLINNGTTREIQIRKKGETVVLFTKKIEPGNPQQNIQFFFDGTKIADNVKLDPPANPANMMISAKFETKYPAQFKNVDVDIVFYANNQTTKVVTKITPEIRFTLSKDGSFNKIELPPLPGPNYIYSFDIFEKGTNTVPYSSLTTPLITSGFPFVANNGRFGILNFEAGKSKLFIIRDKNNLITTTPRGTALSGELTDLSQYFQ